MTFPDVIGTLAVNVYDNLSMACPISNLTLADQRYFVGAYGGFNVTSGALTGTTDPSTADVSITGPN